MLYKFKHDSVIRNCVRNGEGGIFSPFPCSIVPSLYELCYIISDCGGGERGVSLMGAINMKNQYENKIFQR